MKKYNIIALAGKAGAGKDTILNYAMELFPNQLHRIISYTTRPPREKEIDGLDYYFITHEEFQKKILDGDLIEFTSFRGWDYGTGYSALDSSKCNIGVFNPDGLKALNEQSDINLISFYITASDKIRLIRQLNREENLDVQEIIRRFKVDQCDFKDIESFDNIHVVPNCSDGWASSVAYRIVRDAQAILNKTN